MTGIFRSLQWTGLLGGLLISCLVVFLVPQARERTAVVGSPFPQTESTVLQLKLSLTDLLEWPEIELQYIDIALVNLICAQDLLGADGINVSNYLATLDCWMPWNQSLPRDLCPPPVS